MGGARLSPRKVDTWRERSSGGRNICAHSDARATLGATGGAGRMGCGASSGGFAPDGPIGLSHFRIERVVGEGGYGKVKYVIRKDTKDDYAMKCLDKHKLIEKQAVHMALLERAILVDLSTPDPGRLPCTFVTNLHFSFADTHFAYLVMDLALGGTLKYQMRGHPHGYPEEHARFYAAQIFLGLAHLHSKCILYRDCKLDNILLKVGPAPRWQAARGSALTSALGATSRRTASSCSPISAPPRNSPSVTGAPRAVPARGRTCRPRR